MKDTKSTFQCLFNIPVCCFNFSLKTVMHSMEATSAYLNQTMTIFFFIKSQKLFVKLYINIGSIHRHLIDLT